MLSGNLFFKACLGMVIALVACTKNTSTDNGNGSAPQAVAAASATPVPSPLASAQPSASASPSSSPTIGKPLPSPVAVAQITATAGFTTPEGRYQYDLAVNTTESPSHVIADFSHAVAGTTSSSTGQLQSKECKFDYMLSVEQTTRFAQLLNGLRYCTRGGGPHVIDNATDTATFWKAVPRRGLEVDQLTMDKEKTQGPGFDAYLCWGYKEFYDFLKTTVDAQGTSTCPAGWENLFKTR